MKDLLIKYIPDEVHLSFKTFCSSKGASMTETLRQFMAGCGETIVVRAPKEKAGG